MYHAIDDSINSEVEIIGFINKNISTLHSSPPSRIQKLGWGGIHFEKNQQWKPKGGENKKMFEGMRLSHLHFLTLSYHCNWHCFCSLV